MTEQTIVQDTRPRPPGTLIRYETQSGPRFRAFGFTDGKKKSLGSHPTEEQAIEALRTFQASLEQAKGRDTHPPGSLAAWTLEWFARRVKEGHHRSNRDTEICIRLRIVPHPIGQLQLRDITPKTVASWIRDLAATPTRMKHGKPRRQTLVNGLTCIRVILRDALHEDLITSNPASGIRVPKETRTDERWTSLSIDEVRRVLAATSLSRANRNFLTVAFFTGLRAGELYGLRWADVDLQKRTLHVRHSYDGPTKNGTTRRVPLIGPALAALIDHAESSTVSGVPEMPLRGTLVKPRLTNTERKAEGAPGRISMNGATTSMTETLTATGGRITNPIQCADAMRHVFPQRIRSSKRCRDSSASNGQRQALRKALKEAGIDRHVRLHDTRHTFASHLIMGTLGRVWSLNEVKEVLGHSTITTTMRYITFEHGGIQRAAADTHFQLVLDAPMTAVQSPSSDEGQL